MTPDMVVQIVRETLLTTFWLVAPVLLIGFVTGIVVSLVQIATSMQDNAFSTVPRLTAFLAVLVIAMPWMLGKLIGYTAELFGNLGRFAH